MHPFRRLEVWSRSRDAVLQVYRLTQGFPSTERYGLTSQIRRAAVSVAANVTEGAKRLTGREFARFLNIAEASAAETGFLLELSAELGYVGRDEIVLLVSEFARLERMLCSLRKRVTAR